MQSSDYDNTMSGTTGTTGNTGMGMNNAGMGSTTGTGMMGSAGTASGTGGGDMLDKGVDYMEKRGGHEQVSLLSRSIPKLPKRLTDELVYLVRVTARPRKSVTESALDSRR